MFLAGFSLGGLISIDYATRYKQGIQGIIGLSPLLTPLNGSAAAIFGSALSSFWPSFAVEFPSNYAALTRDNDVLSQIRNDPLIHFSGSVKLTSEVT